MVPGLVLSWAAGRVEGTAAKVGRHRVVEPARQIAHPIHDPQSDDVGAGDQGPGRDAERLKTKIK